MVESGCDSSPTRPFSVSSGALVVVEVVVVVVPCESIHFSPPCVYSNFFNNLFLLL